MRFAVRRPDHRLIPVQTRVRQLLARSASASPVGAVHVGRSIPPTVVAAVDTGRPSSRVRNVPRALRGRPRPASCRLGIGPAAAMQPTGP